MKIGLLIILILIICNSWSQSQPIELNDHTWKIYISDSTGNKDSLIFGTNRLARPNILDPSLGEKKVNISETEKVSFAIQKTPNLFTKVSLGRYNNSNIGSLSPLGYFTDSVFYQNQKV